MFVFSSGPGRIKTIFDSPLAAERLDEDVRCIPHLGGAGRTCVSCSNGVRHERSGRACPPYCLAPTVPAAVRLRRMLTSANAIRTASVVVFFIAWEYFGRQMNPIFMAPPSLF